MKLVTAHDYHREARAKLDLLTKAIDDAPLSAKPVFEGIVELHDAVHRYERATKRRIARERRQLEEYREEQWTAKPLV